MTRRAWGVEAFLLGAGMLTRGAARATLGAPTGGKGVAGGGGGVSENILWHSPQDILLSPACLDGGRTFCLLLYHWHAMHMP